MTNDVLPDKKYYEFMYHSYFNEWKNINDFYSIWKPWNEYDYHKDDINRFNKIIFDNVNFIRNKRILDIGCSIGYLSLFCLHAGCSNIRGFDIRSKNITIANHTLNIAGYNNHNLFVDDIHNKNHLTTNLENIDTVLLSGLIYHVHDHVKILDTITNSKIKTLIINVEEATEIMNDKNPLIIWRNEKTDDPQNGWIDGKSNITVGTPNQQFLNCALQDFKCTSHTQYKMKTDTNPCWESVSVYTR
tara:strand:+ start:294 stop:1028 length:735 start_codon:yes stop_codon:yes gene_type:complete